MKKILSVLLLSLFLNINSAFAMKQIFLGGADNSNVDNSAVAYCGINSYDRGCQGTEVVTQQVIAHAGTLSGLYAKLGTSAPGAGKSFTLVVTKNGVDTALTCVITGATDATDTECSDTTHSVNLLQGDLISMKVTPSGTPTSGLLRFSMIFDTTGSANKSIYSAVTSTTLNTAAARYLTVNGAGGTMLSSTESVTQYVVPLAGYISNLTIRITAAPGASKSYAFVLRKNGADTGLVCTISGASDVTCAKNDIRISVAAGDLIDVSATPSGTPTAAAPFVGIVFESSVERKFILFSNSGSTATSASAVRYNSISGCAGPLNSSANGATQTKIKNLAVTITGLYVKAFTAPDNGAGTQTYVAALRDASGALTPTCTISEAETTCSYSGSFSLNVDYSSDYNYIVTPSGTPATTTMAFSAVGNISYNDTVAIRQAVLKGF